MFQLGGSCCQGRKETIQTSECTNVLQNDHLLGPQLQVPKNIDLGGYIISLLLKMSTDNEPNSLKLHMLT